MGLALRRPHGLRVRASRTDRALRVGGLGAPNNIWPDDKAWFTYTDYDLWATKVSGSQDLIARILEDDELEGVILDF